MEVDRTTYDGGNITFLLPPPKKIIHYYIRLHLSILYGDFFLRDITDFRASVHPLIVLNLPAVFSRGQYSYILRQRSLHTLMPPRRNVPEIGHYYVNDPAPPGEVQYLHSWFWTLKSVNSEVCELWTRVQCAAWQPAARGGDMCEGLSWVASL